MAIGKIWGKCVLVIKILILFSFPKKCSAFYLKLCILNTVQLESADYKYNTISKYLFQDSFRHIFLAMGKSSSTI